MSLPSWKSPQHVSSLLAVQSTSRRELENEHFLRAFSFIYCHILVNQLVSDFKSLPFPLLKCILGIGIYGGLKLISHTSNHLK